MDFVDRERELERLRRAAADSRGALVVVWGRRRVGKTRLLLEWVRLDGGVYWVADESGASIQRRYLAAALGERLPGFGDVEYPDWASLFARLARDAKQARFRGPLVIDELPYVVAASPELPSVLQRIVDHEAKSAGLLLALSGSSQAMMQELALGSSSPLFGRAREAMKLSPLEAGHLGRALGMRETRRVVESYACWGGIPRYWELAMPFDDLRRAVDALVLDPLGPLHDEPARLLLEESPPAVALRPILDAIGNGAHRVSEIAARIGQPATSLARPLMRVQELDLVERQTPFGEPERSGKRALYKLADPFLRLWFSVVGPRRSQILQAPQRVRLRLFEERLPHLCAEAWEDLCRSAVPRLGPRLGGIDFGPARRFWQGRGPEWDVVAESDDRRTLLLGECKWLTKDPTPVDVRRIVGELVAKGIPTGLRPAEVHHVVFLPVLPRGTKAGNGNVHLVDAGAVLGVLR